MAVKPSSETLRIISRVLSELGFRKRGRSWVKSNGLLFYVTPFRSRFGPEYFVDLGVHAPSIGPEKPAHDMECHLTSRAHFFLQDRVKQWSRATEDDPGLSREDREKILREALSGPIMDAFAQFGSPDDLLEYARTAPRGNWVVTRDLYYAVNPKDEAVNATE